MDIMSEDYGFRPGYVEGTGPGEVRWRGPVEFDWPGKVWAVEIRERVFKYNRTFETELWAEDAAGNQDFWRDEVFWCPIILEGGDNGRIAVQKGDEILVAVTLGVRWWLTEAEYDGSIPFWGVRTGFSDCTKYDGAQVRAGYPYGLPFGREYGWDDIIHDYCDRLYYVVLDLYYGEPGEDNELAFELYLLDLFGDYVPIYPKGCEKNPDAWAKVTVFDVDLDAEGLAEGDEEDPGLLICVDSDDDDLNGTADFKDSEISLKDPDGNDVTAAVLDDLIALTVKRIDPASDGETATLSVRAPTGSVRLLKKDGGKLTPCGNQVTIPVTVSEGEYYLQGVSASKQERDAAVVLEYDPAQHGDYKWQKKCRDAVWVNVMKVELTRDPTEIAAETLWTAIPSGMQTSIITVDVHPDEMQAAVINHISLEIKEVEAGEGYAPGTGSLSQDPDDETKWLYAPFTEPRTEKHPKPVDVKIVAKYKGIECGDTINVRVKPVFLFLAGAHKHGSGQPVHMPDDDDYNLAWQYVRWKYGISTSNLTSITYDSTLTKAGLTNMILKTCRLGPDAFMNENRCASTLGHENVHGGQSYWTSVKEREIEAYTWEINNAAATGISMAYLLECLAWLEYYLGVGPKPEL